jgi:Tfp pilus assembly PilM family ATPase
MNGSDSIVGISLNSQTIQVVEMDHSGETKTVLAMGEFPSTIGQTSGDSFKGFRGFADAFSSFLKTQGIKSKKVSVALDTSMMFLHTLPVEESLTRAEVNEQLTWELSQYFPETNVKEFITDVHVLTKHPTDHWKEILSVSVRKKDTLWVQNAISSIGRTLHVLDVDHFAAETALRVNYPDTNLKDLALVGIKSHRLDVSLVRKGVMESYKYFLVDSDAEIIEQISSLARDARGVFSIVAYGPHLDNSLLVEIRRTSNILVEALNPFRHVNVSRSVKLGDNLAGPSYRFAAAVGVALRLD